MPAWCAATGRTIYSSAHIQNNAVAPQGACVGPRPQQRMGHMFRCGERCCATQRAYAKLNVGHEPRIGRSASWWRSEAWSWHAGQRSGARAISLVEEALAAAWADSSALRERPMERRVCQVRATGHNSAYGCIVVVVGGVVVVVVVVVVMWPCCC